MSSLVQCNVDAHTLAASVRFSDGRETLRPGYDILNRSIAIKATRLRRF